MSCRARSHGSISVVASRLRRIAHIAEVLCVQRTFKNHEVAVTPTCVARHAVIESTMLAIKGVVIGGDFNTNHDQEMFTLKKTLDSLIGAGFENAFEELPLSQRITHPGTHGFPDATFDYYLRGT